MSIILDEITPSGARLMVMEITEPAVFFCRALDLPEGEGEPGHLHWLTTRYLLRLAFPGFKPSMLLKDEYGKPYLQGGPYLSISHSFNYAAILMHEDAAVALDLEKLDARVERVAHKFVNATEQAWLDNISSRQLALTLIWSFKETLYKQYGRKELDFRGNIFVEPVSKLVFKGTVKKGDFEESWEMYWRRLGEFVVTWIG